MFYPQLHNAYTNLQYFARYQIVDIINQIFVIYLKSGRINVKILIISA
ncbi:hypothetical protein D1AOALGA4SA_1388 [Olavius algarvensis Delta 1 endosymbiont]|nr:hypothetical protein D1AOALGA4SA_1388 [Olavius algarvensis Delta 1 endosymbiont]